MLGLSLVLMLSALDQTVIGNALPSIVAELDGFELYAWVATGYLLASIVTIPIFGRLGDYFGRKPFVIAATLIFTLASLACALASDMLWLVIGRAAIGRRADHVPPTQVRHLSGFGRLGSGVYRGLGSPRGIDWPGSQGAQNANQHGMDIPASSQSRGCVGSR